MNMNKFTTPQQTLQLLELGMPKPSEKGDVQESYLIYPDNDGYYRKIDNYDICELIGFINGRGWSLETTSEGYKCSVWGGVEKPVISKFYGTSIIDVLFDAVVGTNKVKL